MTRPCDKQFKVTQGYANKSALYSKSGGFHKGVDYGCPVGTPVYAMWDGVITSFQWGSAFGKHVIIDHDRFPDDTPGLWAGYMHLSRLKGKAGDRVTKGQVIGYSGNSGHTTGPHLHVEVQKNSHWNKLGSVNPQKWIDA